MGSNPWVTGVNKNYERFFSMLGLASIWSVNEQIEPINTIFFPDSVKKNDY